VVLLSTTHILKSQSQVYQPPSKATEPIIWYHLTKTW